MFLVSGRKSNESMTLVQYVLRSKLRYSRCSAVINSSSIWLH